MATCKFAATSEGVVCLIGSHGPPGYAAFLTEAYPQSVHQQPLIILNKIPAAAVTCTYHQKL